MQPHPLDMANVAETVDRLRPTSEDREQVRGAVADIIDMVRRGGDEAVVRLTERFDGVALKTPVVPAATLSAALDRLDADVRDALERLVENLRAVATETLPRPARLVLPGGQVVATRCVPVSRAGVYVPGGRAAYPSTAVMAIVPAQVAGVQQIAVCSPPGPGGRPDATVMAVCAMLGVSEVYAVGGSQAVAALALGTESIAAVDVLVGPGNAYVEEAKRLLFGEVGIESLAGPSELVVLADASAPPATIALDLMAQAEHGSGARSVLVATDPDVLAAVAEHLADDSQITLVRAASWDAAYAFVNRYAPEHLMLAVVDAAVALERVEHAGAIFLGPLSGTAFGDYIAGSNHILPTGGHARFSSGLGPAAFLRVQEVVELTQPACDALAGPVAALARAEGLTHHARSVLARSRLAPPVP
jgi:histidinol dehydrogenase